MSLLPYEDPSARYQKQLKAQRQQQEAADISEAAADKGAVLKAVSEMEADKDSVSQPSASAETTTTAEETTETKQTLQDTTTPSSGSPDKN